MTEHIAKDHCTILQVILDRQKQTDQESRKLVIVQAELAKIDTLLNTGGSIHQTSPILKV